MTPDQRFTLIMFGLATVCALVGFFGRRILRKNDDRWQEITSFISAESAYAATRSMWIERIEKTEGTVATLAKSVTDLGIIVTRIEAVQDARMTQRGEKP